MNISIEEIEQNNEVKITAIGVGGGGSNAINHLRIHGIYDNIQLIAVNTDKQHLDNTESHKKILIGERITRGFGAGMDSSVGKKSAEESYDQILDAIKDSNIVFVATGLGGGTGTGAAPIIAKAAQESGALTIAVVTKPFNWEGKKKQEIAEEGMRDSFRLVDNILAQAVNGISSIILKTSNGGVNTDYADLEKVMQYKGLALIGIGDKSGTDSAVEAIREAIESPLLDNISINGAKGAIAYYEINENYPINMISEANTAIEQQLDPDAIFKFGIAYNNELPNDQIKATLVVTGFEKELLVKDTNENNVTIRSSINSQGITLKRVSGSNESLFSSHDLGDLESPSFLRNQRD